MGEMTPRERVRAALNREEPDRVPLDLGGITTTLLRETYVNLMKYLGLEYEPVTMLSELFQTVQPHEHVLEKFSIDTRYVIPGSAAPWNRASSGGTSAPADGDIRIDEWGVTRRFIMHYFEIVENPLGQAESVGDLDSHAWPDGAKLLDLRGLKERAQYLREKTDYAVIGFTGGSSILETAWYLRGYEQLMLDMVMNKPFAHALFRKILDIRKRAAGLYLDEVGDYLDVLQMGDDLATQGGPVFSPALYREMVKPYQAELFSFIKEKCGVKIFYHTCGGVVELLDDLIEIGVDVLNPVQASAKGMGAAELKRLFGQRIAFWGGIDSQHVLPFGTPEDVCQEVQKRTRELAPGGGYVLAGVHNLQPDVPPQNIEAMYNAGLRFGRYPIGDPTTRSL